VNRTIMSAYSELIGWYPLGNAASIPDGQDLHAVPPFEITDKATVLADLGSDATLYAFQPMPIHVSQEIRYMLLANEVEVCPVITRFENAAREEKLFKQANERFKDNILKMFRENWGITEELDFESAKAYTDNFYTAFFDKRLNNTFQLPVDIVDEMLADQFYNSTFFYDEMVRIASTHFLNYVHTTMDAKINSIATGEDDGSGIKARKLIYMSAHDNTLAAMLSGIEQKQRLQPFYASHFLIELWQKIGTEGAGPDDFYVKWIYNNQTLNVNGTCDDEGRCPYSQFKSFLQYREYQGDWMAACIDTDASFSGAWYIVVGTAAGVMGIGVIGYFVIKKMFLTPKA
jgi:hypothetical protein